MPPAFYPVAWLRATIEGDKKIAETSGFGEKREHAIRHIVRHGPQDVIADCEAKLAILERHLGDPDSAIGGAWCVVCDFQHLPCPTVRLMASGYRYRPGYQEAWGAMPVPQEGQPT